MRAGFGLQKDAERGMKASDPFETPNKTRSGDLRAGFRWAVLMVSLLATPAWATEDGLWPEPVDAVVVLDENEFVVRGQNRAKYRKHRVVKIYNEAGKKYGQVAIWENKYVKCTHISGKISDADGNLIRKLDKDKIRKNPYVPEFVLYQDTQYRAFELEARTFPYLVEYAYEREYDSLFFWPSWYPQEDVPVLKSTYTLLGHDKVDYRTHAIGMADSPTRETSSERAWGLERIKPSVKERAMPPEDRIQMGLFFAPATFQIDKSPGSFASWDAVAKWYESLAKGRYDLPQSAVQNVQKLVSKANSDQEKVEILYRHLQDQTRYVAIELGIGAWQPYSAEWVLKNKYGDCKDLSTFMVAMLKACGISAYPALIGTRDRGVLIREFPSSQFNHCIAFVPLERDTLWLECTADLIAAGHLPSVDEGCDVLVVKEDAGEIIRTPQSTSRDNRQISAITGRLTSFGTFTFSGALSGTGHVATKLRRNLHGNKAEGRKRYLSGQLGRYLPVLDLATYEIDHLHGDFDRPLEVRLSGTSGKFGSRSAKRLFVNPNIVNRATPRDVPREKDRQFPVYHAYPHTHIDSLSLGIPEGYALETAPETKEITTPFGSFKTTYRFSEGALHHTRTFALTQRQIPLSQYETYVAFMKEIVKADQTPYVFVSDR